MARETGIDRRGRAHPRCRPVGADRHGRGGGGQGDDFRRLCRGLSAARPAVRARQRPHHRDRLRPFDGQYAGSDPCPPCARRAGGRPDHGRPSPGRPDRGRQGAGRQPCRARAVAHRHGGPGGRPQAGHRLGRGVHAHAARGAIDRVFRQRERHLPLDRAVRASRHRRSGQAKGPDDPGRTGRRRRRPRRGRDRLSADQRTASRARRRFRRAAAVRVAEDHGVLRRHRRSRPTTGCGAGFDCVPGFGGCDAGDRRDRARPGQGSRPSPGLSNTITLDTKAFTSRRWTRPQDSATAPKSSSR